MTFAFLMIFWLLLGGEKNIYTTILLLGPVALFAIYFVGGNIYNALKTN